MLLFAGVRPPPPGVVFFFNDTATTEIYTLSLHDALPISCDPRQQEPYDQYHENSHAKHWDYHKTPLIGRQPTDRKSGSAGMPRPISYAVFCLKKKKTKASCAFATSPTQVVCPPARA